MRGDRAGLVAVGDGHGFVLHVFGHFAHKEHMAVEAVDRHRPAAREAFIQQGCFDFCREFLVVGYGSHKPLVVIDGIACVGAAVDQRHGKQQQSKSQSFHGILLKPAVGQNIFINACGAASLLGQRLR